MISVNVINDADRMFRVKFYLILTKNKYISIGHFLCVGAEKNKIIMLKNILNNNRCVHSNLSSCIYVKCNIINKLVLLKYIN